MQLFSRTIAASALLAMIALAGCGGGKSSTTAATAVPTTEAQRETAALPLAGAAPMPAGMNCGATKPVWVNMHTKAYHEAGDPYYGKTKNGQYMCASAAVAAGYHLAGTRHKGVNAAATDESGNAMATPAGKKHKHHKKNDMTGSQPEPTDTP